MKKKNNINRILAAILALAMIFLASCGKKEDTDEPQTGDDNSPAANYSDTTQNVKKSETVFVNLMGNGQVKNITVSDWIHADKGQVYITDKTTLTDFTVTKGQASSVTESGNITWQMTTSDIYYEGSSNKLLPVDIKITYYLDGKEITPAELAGKSGKFKMEVKMINNISKEVEINGKKVTMYAPLAAVGGMVLSYEHFSDIEVTNGLSIGGGSYEVAVLAGAPGLNESLDLSGLNISGFEDFSFPDTFTVSATVTDFKLSDSYYAIVPLSSLNLNINLPKTLEDVRKLLNEVQDIGDILDRIDPNQILTNFVTDGTSLKEMMSTMQKAVNLYENNKELFKVMTQYLTPENIETLSNFMNTLDGEQMQQLINLLSNVPALQTLVSSLMQLSTGLDEVMPILQGMSEALNDPKVAKELENLPETLKTLDELMNYMNDNKEVLDILSKLMASDDINELTGVLDSITSAAGDNIGSTDVSNLTGDAKVLVERVDEWLKFDYSIYTDAPDYMETSCMFIYKTDPIGNS